MRLAIVFCLFATTITTCAAETQETAVRAVIQQYVDAREHATIEALTPLFTENADQLVSSGEWRKGREAVVRGTIAATQKENGHRTVTIESVRFLGKTVAMADGRYELTNAAGSVIRKMWTSIVLTRGATGKWRIAAIRNMLPAK